ncbi:hypothetical protein [Psychroserpens mesophilus]|uniref:hypothetical protein n=1 Tax=Psychroserpens mesophilus TaxID=325473 RepID=UPI00059029F1|nr:hypothetical protein [Psychroserpens mesophilus]
MRKTIFTLLTLALLTCSENIPTEFDGYWIISAMEYKGEPIYPETITDKFEANIVVSGFENAENIRFINSEQAAYLPGFKGDRILVDFVTDLNKIEFKLHEGLDYEPKQYELTKRIFLRNYIIKNGNEEGELIFESDSTVIKLISQKILFEKQIDKVFDGL